MNAIFLYVWMKAMALLVLVAFLLALGFAVSR